MGFRTKLDYSDNRQIKQHIETLTHLSGATTFGVPFNQLPTGPNLTTTGITETLNSLGSLFSGNGTTTIFEWYDNRMELGYPFLSAITPSNSGVTQNVPITFTASSTTVIDGNTVALAYSGVSFDLTPIAMYDLGGGNYSGTVVSDIVDFFSATTLDFTGRTIWADVSGITRTNRLMVTENAVVGNILTCVDSDGTVALTPLSASPATEAIIFWSGGTGLHSLVTKYSDNIASGNYSLAEGYQTIASGDYSHAEGQQSIANGTSAHAEGRATMAQGLQSHAEGFSTLAIGNQSHAGGNSSIASGSTSFVHGLNSRANGSNTIVLGANITGNTDNTTYVDNLKTKNNLTIGTATITEDLAFMANATLSTGLFFFNNSGITSTASTTFNLGRVHGWIVNSADSLNNTPTFVQYNGASGLTTPYLNTAPASYLFINSGSTLTINNTPPTVTDRRNMIYLGVIGHPLSGITGIGNAPDIIMNEMSQVRAMFTPIKYINDGIIPYPNSTNMTLANTSGKLFGLGIGFITNGNNAPSVLDIAAGTPTMFQYRTQTGQTFSNTTTISGGTYDLNGVGTAIPGSNNQATNQRIYLLQNGGIRVQFGQTIYPTLTDAIAAAQNESFTVFSNNKNLGILIGILSVTKGCTNLSNTITAKFLLPSKFGETVGASAGISTATLQSAYNNSSEPEFLTNSTLNSVVFRRGSAADTDNIIVGQNGAGTNTFMLNGNGGLSATTLNIGSASTSSGLYSLTQGYLSTASGAQSFASGRNTLSSGDQTHAEGFGTIASGTYAHAEGSQTTASGPNGSHAEGVNTTASGSASHAEGVSTTAGGAASHAQGSSTKAIGDYSHSSGFGTLANNAYSFVHGSNSTANANYSIVLGRDITGSTADTTYVDKLNIKTVGAGPGSIDIGVDANGNVVNQASDITLKENISTLENALEKVKNLRGVKYQWKDRVSGGDEFRIGFIAQEVNEVEPLLVTNIGSNLLGVQYKDVTALLVEAIKELSYGVTTTTNTYLKTQTILAEDNNIDLNYNGTQETAIGGGVSVLNAKPNGDAAEFKTDADGNWITNNALKPDEIIIPLYTPSATTDMNGHVGSLSRDENYLYVKGVNGWKRTNLENF